MSTRLDPDALARLETERDFLLRSLDDLDAELGVGDIDEVDHRELHDDYTRRAAEVLRAIEEQRQAFADARRGLTTGQRVLSFIGVIAIAAIAGVLLARAVGFRSPSGELSGGIRQTTAGLLNEADTLTREGRWQDAFDTYELVIDQEPSNTEALTYSGWLAFTHLGEPQLGLDRIADAVATDPEYPDARVFSALTARRQERWNDAVIAVEAFDAIDDKPAEMIGLVETGNLRGQIVAGLMSDQYDETGEIDLDGLPFDIDAAANGAALLDSQEQIVAALAGFDAVLTVDPTNRVALIGMGRRLATTSPETAERGLGLLDEAVANDPDDLEALVWRGFSRAVAGDTVGAQSDLDLLDESGVPPELMEFVEGLRAGLSG